MMIRFIQTGDLAHIQWFLATILAMWVIQVLSVVIDFWSGTNTAKALGQTLASNGFRRSFAKLGDYWRVTVMFLFIDLVGGFFDWYNLPFATMIVTLGVIVIEAWSVHENAKSKKSQAAKLPDAIRAIIQCADAKSAEELLIKLAAMANEQKPTEQ